MFPENPGHVQIILGRGGERDSREATLNVFSVSLAERISRDARLCMKDFSNEETGGMLMMSVDAGIFS